MSRKTTNLGFKVYLTDLGFLRSADYLIKIKKNQPVKRILHLNSLQSIWK